ncbi:MAG: carboxypeptidase regulatory-like domain-containing protein [Vicinamibacteria bacterium]
MLSALVVLAVLAPTASGTAVSGRVLDPHGNAVRATVTAYAEESAREAARRQAVGRGRTALASVETAADGTFRIAAPPRAIVEATAGGFLADAAVADGAALTLELRDPATVRGVVRGPAGPVAGAVVAWTYGGVEVLATTAPDGSYRVPARRPAEVRVFHPDFAVRDVPFFGAMGGDVRLDAGAAVSGVVTDAGGRPAPGVSVWLDDALPGGTTDAGGRFSIPHAGSGWQQVTARSGRLVGAASRRSGPLALRLGPPRVLSGTVREEGTRAPLAGVTVTAFVDGSAARAVTDAQGRYALDDLAPAAYRLRAAGDGLTGSPTAPVSEDPVDLARAPAARRDLVLVRLPSLRGTVLDEQRRPVAGAAVGLGFKGPQVYGAEGIDIDSDRWARATVRTGADGSFSLPVPLNRQELAAKALGFERWVVALKQGFAVGTAPLPAPGAPAAPVVVALRRGVELGGRVVTNEGAPVAGANVFLAETGTLASTMVPMHVLLGALETLQAWARTDGAGRFSVRVHPGGHEVSVHKTGYARRTLRDQQPGAAPLEVVLDPAASVSGRVVRADGRGVAGVRITTTAEIQAFPREAVESDVDGAFAVGDLSPGLYSLFAQHPQLGTIGSRMVEAPARDVVFALPAAGTVRGRAIDAATREPLRQFTIAVSPGEEGGSWEREGTVDDGGFVVEDVPAGVVTLTASAEGYASGRVEDVTVVADAEPAEVEVALRADAPITGQVTDESGGPVQAAVSGRAKDGSASGASGADPEGRYELRGLPAGEVELQVQARGYATEKRTADTRQGGRVDIVLKRGLALRGEVVGDGAPVARASVYANGAGRGGSAYATTDERGRFTLEGLEPGRYAVSARAADGRHAQVEDVDASQAAALRIVLERQPTAVLTGRVVGLPSEGDALMAMVQANGDGSSGTAPVDGARRFRMEDAPAGAVTVRAEAMSMNGTQRSSRPLELTLAAGSETEVVVEFPDDIVIGGLVTRDGAPVPFAGVTFSRDDLAASGTRADARGAYEIVGVEPGVYAVAVTASEPQTAFATEYAVAGSGQFDIDIAGAVLGGRVVRADTGAPVADVGVSLFRAGEGQSAGAASTSTQGTFTVRSLRDGAYRVVTSKSGFGQAVREVDLVRGSPADVTLELAPADGVSLTVVDGRDGRTLDGIVVVRDAQKRIVANQHSGAGADGVLDIPLADGSYVLSTSATGYGTATLPVTAPSSGLKVALTPGGTLVLASEKSLHGRVRLLQPDGEEYVRCWCNGIAEIQLKGRRTTVENVTAGSYTVEVMDGGLGIAPRPAVIREGQTTTVTLE